MHAAHKPAPLQRRALHAADAPNPAYPHASFAAPGAQGPDVHGAAAHDAQRARAQAQAQDGREAGRAQGEEGAGGCGERRGDQSAA